MYWHNSIIKSDIGQLFDMTGGVVLYSILLREIKSVSPYTATYRNKSFSFPLMCHVIAPLVFLKCHAICLLSFNSFTHSTYVFLAVVGTFKRIIPHIHQSPIIALIFVNLHIKSAFVHCLWPMRHSLSSFSLYLLCEHQQPLILILSYL